MVLDCSALILEMDSKTLSVHAKRAKRQPEPCGAMFVVQQQLQLWKSAVRGCMMMPCDRACDLRSAEALKTLHPES